VVEAALLFDMEFLHLKQELLLLNVDWCEQSVQDSMQEIDGVMREVARRKPDRLLFC
jgi:hypothetical protein